MLIELIALLLVFIPKQEVSPQVTRPTEDYFLRHGYRESRGIYSYFSQRSEADIKSLKFHDELFISVMASWIVNTIELKRMNENDEHEVECHRQRFVSFLSGRINAPIPEWWSSQVKQLTSERVYLLKFDYSRFKTAETFNFHRSIDVSVQNDTIDWRIGESSISVDWELLRKQKRGLPRLQKVTSVGGLIDSDAKAILVVDFDGDIVVTARDADGAELWTVLLNSNTQYDALGVSHMKKRNLIQVIEGNQDKVLIFGANNYGVYAFALESDHGSVIGYFQSNFQFPALLK